MRRAALLSALAYTGVSLILAGGFFLVTSMGDYPVVARYGGTAWVFLLAMIITMPTVAPWVRKRLAQRGPPASQAQKMASAEGATTLDPVCGMTIAVAEATGKSEYEGQTYYFCAPACKQTFDAEPEKYLKGSPDGMASHGHEEPDGQHRPA